MLEGRFADKSGIEEEKERMEEEKWTKEEETWGKRETMISALIWEKEKQDIQNPGHMT